MKLTARIKVSPLSTKTRHALYISIVVLILATGCFVRLYGIGTLSTGINQDEASIGYDAFAVANYGIDRNGVFNPVYLIAWGSGQNAGYMWLLIPWIKLFGLTLTTLRLPMALAGCVSLYAVFRLLHRQRNKKLELTALFLFAICPWHILKSRWALESNLFPEFLLWGVVLFSIGMGTKKLRYFYLGSVILGFSSWNYATSFIVLPLFLVPSAIILWKQRYLPLRHLFGCAGVFILAALPIILFAIITIFHLPSITTPLFTIPALPYPRDSEFALFSDTPLASLIANGKALFRLLQLQQDDNLWNAVEGYGLFYLFSVPFLIIGFLRSVLPANHGGIYRNIVPGAWMFTLLATIGIILGIMVVPNINRVNVVWIPLLWFWILGVYDVIRNQRLWRWALTLLYTLCFALYLHNLFGNYMDELNAKNQNGFLESVQFADTLHVQQIQVQSSPQSYIRILFALQMPPQEFRSSIFSERTGEYGKVDIFGKWNCTGEIAPGETKSFAIIVNDVDVSTEWPEFEWTYKQFGDYTVAWPTDEPVT